MAEEQKYQAVGLSPVGRYALGVRWGDSHESIFSFTYLRAVCPCEECRTAENLTIQLLERGGPYEKKRDLVAPFLG